MELSVSAPMAAACTAPRAQLPETPECSYQRPGVHSSYEPHWILVQKNELESVCVQRQLERCGPRGGTSSAGDVHPPCRGVGGFGCVMLI